MLWMRVFRRPFRGAVLTFHQPSLRSQIQRDVAAMLAMAGDRAWPGLLSGFGWGVFEKPFSIAEGDSTFSTNDLVESCMIKRLSP